MDRKTIYSSKEKHLQITYSYKMNMKAASIYGYKISCTQDRIHH